MENIAATVIGIVNIMCFWCIAVRPRDHFIAIQWKSIIVSLPMVNTYLIHIQSR